MIALSFPTEPQLSRSSQPSYTVRLTDPADPRSLVTVASKAQAAVDYLNVAAGIAQAA